MVPLRRHHERLLACLTLLFVTGVDCAVAADLTGLYEDALHNNLDIMVASDRARATAEAVPQARAALLPSVGIRVSRSKVEQKRTIQGVAFPSEAYDLESDGIQLSQPVFRPALWLDLRRARQVKVSAEADVLATRQEVAVAVVESYLAQAEAQEQVALVTAEIQRREFEVRAAEAALKAGTGTRVTIDETNADLARLRAERLAANSIREQQLARLRAMVGEEVPAPGTIDWARFSPEVFLPASPEALVTQAEASSPRFAGLRAASAAAHAALNAARANHLPSLDLVARMSTDSGSNPFFADNGVNQRAIGIEVQVPLFAGGALFSKDREAAAQLQQQEDTYLTAQRDVALSIRQTHDAVLTGIARLRTLHSAAAAADSAVTSTQHGIRAGIRSTLDGILAERQRYEVQLALTAQRHAILKDWFFLAIVSGQDEREALSVLDVLATFQE